MKGRKPTLRTIDGKPIGEDQAEELENNETIESLGPVPEPPDYLGYEAKIEWIKIAPGLHKQGRLDDNISSMLEAYCIACGIIRDCNLAMQTDGNIYGRKPHPAFAMMIAALKEARLLAAELRFTRQDSKIKELENLAAPRSGSSWNDKEGSLLA